VSGRIQRSGQAGRDVGGNAPSGRATAFAARAQEHRAAQDAKGFEPGEIGRGPGRQLGDDATVAGDQAGELIASLSLAMAAGINRRQLEEWIIPHPTLSEVLRL